MNLLLGTMGFESISVGVVSRPRVTLLAQGMPFLRWGSLSLSMALQSLLSGIYLDTKYQGSIMFLALHQVMGK